MNPPRTLPIAPRSTRVRPETVVLLRLYRPERWEDVIHQAVLLKATADGVVDVAGRPKRRRP